MYIYLARNECELTKHRLFLTVKKPGVYNKDWGVWKINDLKCEIDTLPILNPEDKPKPMLLDLGKVELPGWLCYKSKGEMCFAWIKIHSLYSGGMDSLCIPILKPGQCKRISIKV